MALVTGESLLKVVALAILVSFTLLVGSLVRWSVGLDMNCKFAQKRFISGEGTFGTDESAFMSILMTRSNLHLRAVFEAYEGMRESEDDKTLLGAIQSEFTGNEEKLLCTIGIGCCSILNPPGPATFTEVFNRVHVYIYCRVYGLVLNVYKNMTFETVKYSLGTTDYFVDLLRECVEGVGTSERRLINTIVGRAEVCKW